MNECRGFKNSPYAQIGAIGHSSKERVNNDFYATPPEAVEMLLKLEKFNQNIWEPACGQGHIAKVLNENGYFVKSTDLIDRGYGIGNVDFLKQTESFHGDIITNPPYKYAKEFVGKALELVSSGAKVAMFLKLQFLEGKARRKLFDTYPPPKSLCQLFSPKMRKKWSISEERRKRSVLCVVHMGEGV